MPIDSGNMIQKFALNKLMEFVFAGAVMAPKELGDKRVEICNKCKYKGIVEPLPLLKMPGCTICGCPFSTKPYLLEIPRVEDKLGEPLTLTEIIESKLSRSELVMEKIICPHPNGDMWATLV